MVTKIIFSVLLVLNLGLTAFLGWSMFQTHLVPGAVTIIAVAALALLALVLFLVQRERKGKKKTGLRMAGIVILLFLCLVEGAVGYYVQHYKSGMAKVTDVRTEVTQMEIYVKDDNPAQTIEYAVESKYRFGTIAGVDEEAVAQTKEELEDKYGRPIAIQSYGTLMDLIKAISENQVDALLMSSAYLDLIEDLPDFESFGESLRVLHTSSVKTEILQESFLETFPEEIEEKPMKDPDLWTDCFCAYISGIDTYGPVSARSRSDVNILAIVNVKTKTVLLISTPRDYYVPFNFAPVNGALDKLTHAGIYGIEGSMRALSDLYGLPIHYYVRVNFTGFIKVIDTLGGVDVESDAAFSVGSTYFQKGMNHLNGRAALLFARDRHHQIDGDRARSRHQMAVIKGVINELKSSKIILNYVDLMQEMQDCFQTNASLTMVGDLVQLTLDPSLDDWKVLTYNVDGNGKTDYAYSQGSYAYCMHPNMKTVEYAQSLVEVVLAGGSMTQEELLKNAPSPRGDK